MQQRPIKALSAEQQQGLTEGKGLGYARAAELNGYPGPMHATELADQLGLSPEQAQSARALMAAVFAESVPLGQRLVALEAELDRRFATGDLDEAEMRRLTAEIATVEGQYRAAHLAAHLKLRAILTPEQVARYNQLRGYDAPGGQPGHQHSH